MVLAKKQTRKPIDLNEDLDINPHSYAKWPSYKGTQNTKGSTSKRKDEQIGLHQTK
jgi:hypothetical protein